MSFNALLAFKSILLLSKTTCQSSFVLVSISYFTKLFKFSAGLSNLVKLVSKQKNNNKTIVQNAT